MSLESSHCKYSFPEYHYWSRSNERADNMAPGYKSTTYPNAYRWSSTALLVFHYQSEMGSLKHHRGKAEEKLTNEECLFLLLQKMLLNATIWKKFCFHVWSWVDIASPQRTKIKKQSVQPALPWFYRKGFAENSVYILFVISHDETLSSPTKESSKTHNLQQDHAPLADVRIS